jgi:hypothetical protein
VTSIDNEILCQGLQALYALHIPIYADETMLLDINALSHARNTTWLHSTTASARHLYVLVVLLLAVDLHAAIPVELNGGGQAGDLLVVLGHDVGENGVLSGRDLLRQLDVLGQGQLALLNRALEVDVLDGVAQVGGLPDDGDQAVLD